MLFEQRARVLANFRGLSSLATWLQTVAARFFSQQASRIERDRGAPLESVDPERLVFPGQSAEEEQIRRSELERVKQAMSRLSEGDSSFLMLAIDPDLPTHALADSLGVTPDAVRMRRMRILRRLRKILGA
jgi:DNA-directed RNA polymerase specialized sigma24 family protein